MDFDLPHGILIADRTPVTGAEYLAFLAASAILALTPGPDTFLTLRFGAHHVRDGLVYTVAVALGVMAWRCLP
ncbi:hypothetical protein [Arthrobacter roseus]|uniref:hypothetical protein n=1 Tax=Arthrobacter roseus TaxID=136274 RepID=UPI001EF91A58|nr:hypothetical protein [Arthrobacter roseus]MBM7847367.1 threonine/homoserine/homoserine lactone efflux protein [Arthrobacter roseus]